MGGTSAVIPAAGRGERLGHNDGKAFVPLDGIPILAWTLAAVEACAAVDEIVVVVQREEIDRVWRLAVRYGFRKLQQVVEGGPDRQSSVLNGIEAASPGSAVILVHDAARPLTPPEVMARCAAAAEEFGSATAALPVVDTLREGQVGGLAGQTLDRSALVRIQTPQAIKADLVRRSLPACRSIAVECTDDSSMTERVSGVRAQLVQGSELSLKITTQDDLILAEALVREGRGTRPWRAIQSEEAPVRVPASLPMRVGLGYDVHSFDPARRMMLGGVLIPDSPGLAGHSDADVALHAICDAILGAAGEHDIGFHFPNTDEAYAGADSASLLERVVCLVRTKNWRPLQVDVTVIAERPKLAPHVPAMQRRLAGLLGLDQSDVAVKATTNEKMGFIGRSEGIACFALATLGTCGGEKG
ncbi:MAG: 2-C-methyl-D-erythritol 4-phosphate cytidylyltransferase [Chloroflexi bacterium]|nr:2-C-methyl-D-erythritol 4-phosphate cytidylyltransferase [Chloroflexota bacterium]